MRWLTFFLLFATSLAQGQAVNSPKTESEALLNAALPIAERMLAEHGEFFPYAQAMDESGNFVAIGASDGRKHPPSTDVIEILKHGLRAGATSGKYKATAIVYDARITLPNSGAKSDAIAVSLNHKANYAVLVLFPYRMEGKKVVMGDALAQQEENYSFAGTQ
jgi:hypothetical protein